MALGWYIVRHYEAVSCVPVLVQTALTYPSCWREMVREMVGCGVGYDADVAAAAAAAAAGTCSSGDP